ncbi:Ger(x)C family spore germination protein [Paenibacillus chibensis]|uniref:Ger(x)C family spore germination protein n=1 Tax=Paenibacillus chibensis TaxID=59846 RepID=UPI000FD8F73D|nr:Ger(x)C family spore germination C-terminal domain-containing protein [Paenibacillus chibensis]MEC0369150.1 Ger(x)C family spore germination C-terminal domain-containing protein [Paenibacillus chibensis]
MRCWKRLLHAIMCAGLLLQTGCWSKVEVDEELFVLALFVDKGEKPGTVEVTISSPLPNRMMSGQPASGGSSGKSYTMVTRTDLTLPDTIRSIQKDLTRRINFGHTREIVVGRDYAKDGIADLLDWIHMEPSLHISTFLTTAPGKAKEVAKLTPVYEQLPSEVLRKMMMQHTLFSTKLKESLIARFSKVGYATNLMYMTEAPLESDDDSSQQWAGIQGAAVYQEDRLSGTLPLREARALAWGSGTLGKQVYTVYWDEGKSHASVLFTSFDAHRKVNMTKQGPQFTIYLQATGNMVNRMDAKHRNATEMTQLVTDLLNKKAVEELESAINMTQDMRADALKLGLLLEWKYPGYWDRDGRQVGASDLPWHSGALEHLLRIS